MGSTRISLGCSFVRNTVNFTIHTKEYLGRCTKLSLRNFHNLQSTGGEKKVFCWSRFWAWCWEWNHWIRSFAFQPRKHHSMCTSCSSWICLSFWSAVSGVTRQQQKTWGPMVQTLVMTETHSGKGVEWRHLKGLKPQNQEGCTWDLFSNTQGCRSPEGNPDPPSQHRGEGQTRLPTSKLKGPGNVWFCWRSKGRIPGQNFCEIHNISLKTIQ